MKLPTLAAFIAAAKNQDLVAMAVPLAFDHETAVTLADRFVSEAHLFLLESATAGPHARHSFVGFDPLWTWSYDQAAATATWDGPEGRKVIATPDPMAGLRALVKGTKLTTLYPEGVRLGGPDVAAMAGAAGFFGYDVARALEPKVGKAPPRRLGLPDAFFFMPRNFLVLDHLARRLFVSRNISVRGLAPAALTSLYEQETKKLLGLVKRLSAVHSPAPLTLTDSAPDFDACTAAVTKAEFTRRAERCLEEIRAGEIFQIQIGNRLSLKTEARPFDIFRHLRMINPSPYMFFYKVGDHHVLGASPEMMVNVQADLVTHRPIAGTRKRTWDWSKDQLMRRELVESEKERAEHVMLVDLGRNDIGRVAAPGSVQVEELMTVEEYSHVFHMVSQVTGRLAPGRDAFDAMTVSFPNGTVTGAPKIRAMQLINELESVSREFYAGSLALFDTRGDLRSTLLIRTIHVANGVASTQASAGMVYDSIPEQEWLETRNKMAACVLAMQNTN